MSLWKGKRAEDPGLDLHQIETLLKTALTLDPKSAEAHLQLGNLYSDQNKYAEAIPEYEKARSLIRIWPTCVTVLARRMFVPVKKTALSSNLRFIKNCERSTWPNLISKGRTFDSLFIRRKMRRLRNNDGTI